MHSNRFTLLGALAAATVLATLSSQAWAGSVLVGTVNGTLALHDDTANDGDDGPRYLRIQNKADETDIQGAQFAFAPPLDTYFEDSGQYGFDLILPDPLGTQGMGGTVGPEGGEPTLSPTYKADTVSDDDSSTVVWALNDYKPSGPTNDAATVKNTLINATRTDSMAVTDTMFSGTDPSGDGSQDILSGSATLTSDGFVHWFDTEDDKDGNQNGRTSFSQLGPAPNGESYTGRFFFAFENALETSSGTDGDGNDIDYFTLEGATVRAETAVPTPTAGVLGLVGFGLLALRRRRRGESV